MDFSQILKGGRLSFQIEFEDDGLPSITCPSECDSHLDVVVHVVNWMLSSWWYNYELDTTYGKHGFDGNYVHTLSDREMDEETDEAMEELDDNEKEFVNANREEIKKTFQEVVKQIVSIKEDCKTFIFRSKETATCRLFLRFIPHQILINEIIIFQMQSQ